jgi:hypothetical protein
MTAGATQQHDTAVVFLTHRWSPSLGLRFARLRRETAALADAFLLLHTDDDEGGAMQRQWRVFMQSIDAAEALLPFTRGGLRRQLGFDLYAPEAMTGSAHFPLMAFARSRAYRQYWQVEYDVEYRGDWGLLLQAYRDSDAALLAAHIHRYADWPDWVWWASLWVPPVLGVTQHHLLKAFLPVFRASRAAIEATRRAHVDGWRGHAEVLMPTVLAVQGHSVEDLRARRPSYAGDSQNPCEIVALQSTVRFRPPIELEEFCRRGQGPLLFHPVKDDWAFDGTKVVSRPGASHGN